MIKIMQDKPRVLFVCTGNSCRSQMAEGLLKHYGNGGLEVYSAGLRPSYVHPLAIKAMAELDIDITNQYSKTINEYIGQKFTYVITVCDSAKELCPVFPGKYKALHWSIEDPASTSDTEEEMMKVFRKVRQNLLEKVVITHRIFELQNVSLQNQVIFLEIVNLKLCLCSHLVFDKSTNNLAHGKIF